MFILIERTCWECQAVFLWLFCAERRASLMVRLIDFEYCRMMSIQRVGAYTATCWRIEVNSVLEGLWHNCPIRRPCHTHDVLNACELAKKSVLISFPSFVLRPSCSLFGRRAMWVYLYLHCLQKSCVLLMLLPPYSSGYHIVLHSIGTKLFISG